MTTPVSPCEISLTGVTISFPLSSYMARQSWVRDDGRNTGGRIVAGQRGGRRIVALDDINLTLKSGDRLGILGHNGAGKSTLLRTMMGIYPPASGEIRVVGRIASMLDIHTGFDNNASGLDNIRLRALFMDVPEAELKARLPELAAFTELGEYLNLPLSTYSSGMRARLAFAIATGFTPQIIVMDEWLSAGDRDFRGKAEKRMAQFVEQSDILVIASHNDELLKRTCNRAIVLSAGKVLHDGDVDEALAVRSGERGS